MKWIAVIWGGCLLSAAGALLTGFILAESWSLALSVLVLALLSVLEQRLKVRWLVTVLLVAYYIVAIIGLWNFDWPGWSWIALTASLATWDLSRFARRYHSAMYIVNGEKLARRHALRLLVVITMGALVSILAVTAQVGLNFGLALILGALVVLGLSQGINLLKRSE